VDRFPLPEVQQGDTFGASDTTYLQLNRDIQLPANSLPADMFIDDDGHIYVALTDTVAGTAGIGIWDQALNEIGWYDITEQALADSEAAGDLGIPVGQIMPLEGLCVSREELLLAVTGYNTLWARNLQVEREEILFAFTSITLEDPATGNPDTLSAAEFAGVIEEDSDVLLWTVVDIDSLALDSPELTQRLGWTALWTGAGATRLSSVAPGRPGWREVHVSNNNRFGSRVHRIRFDPEVVLLTANPEVPAVYLYSQTEEAITIYWGTGQGTVEKVLALDADLAGNVYLTQSAPSHGYWKAQRFYAEDQDDASFWTFDFGLQGSQFMEFGRFQDAVDITYTDANMFVLDRKEGDSLFVEADSAWTLSSSRHQVQVYRRNGVFTLPCGASRAFVDTVLTVDGQPDTTTVKVWVYDQLEDPHSVAVYGNRSERAGTEEEFVFVADGDRIKIFTLSISADDLPVE